GCLERKYASFMEPLDKAAWRCPHCMGACTSKKCLKAVSARKKKGKQLDPTTFSPFEESYNTLLHQNTMLLEHNRILMNRTADSVTLEESSSMQRDGINKLQQKLKEMDADKRNLEVNLYNLGLYNTL
ncbi:hypothetical protein Tco_1258028, partial [Tanacetum coccineum]